MEVVWLMLCCAEQFLSCDSDPLSKDCFVSSNHPVSSACMYLCRSFLLITLSFFFLQLFILLFTVRVVLKSELLFYCFFCCLLAQSRSLLSRYLSIYLSLSFFVFDS
jgi:hypothetical protein